MRYPRTGGHRHLRGNIQSHTKLRAYFLPNGIHNPGELRLSQLVLPKPGGVCYVESIVLGYSEPTTGSGKTFTSARWLTENHINHGGKVLWLAPRHELLEQAAQAFGACASLAKNIEEIRIRIVSGLHSPSAAIGPTDTVVCASIQSLARNADVVSELLADDRIFLVVDEAHHASAKSYRDIIEELRARDSYKILGLTATPTRTIIHEQPVLSVNPNFYEVSGTEPLRFGFHFHLNISSC